MPENPVQSQLLSLNEEDRFKLLQAVHTALTGKSPKRTRAFDAKFRIGPEHLEQLHVKLAQIRTQWSQVSLHHESVTFYYVGGHRDEFPSYELCKIYDKTRAEPIEYINYQSNFVITRPGEQPESYTVDVRIVSTAAIMEGFTRMMGSMAAVLRFVSIGAITLETKYVQLPVALGIEACVESWVKEIDQEKLGWLSKYGPRYSHWFPRAFSLLIAVIATTAACKAAVALPVTASPRDTAVLLVLSLPVVYLSTKIAQQMGRIVEAEIDQADTRTYLKFNLGDQKLNDKSKRHIKTLCAKSIFAGVLVVVQAFYVSPLLDWLHGVLKAVGLKS